ncbi:MAG TPA: hypothetical protein VK673_10440 [Chthoniobacterales bacterium]|nr:hypothetical protein [Chthoniobacterales bacterium]
MLAIEALKEATSLRGVPIPAVEESLREVLAAVGGTQIARSEGVITAAGISPDMHWMVTCSDDATVRLWDVTAKGPLLNSLVLRGHKEPVRAVAISSDNHWLVTTSYDKTVRLWDLTAKDPAANPEVLTGHENGVDAVAISPNDHWLVTGSSDRTARLWDPANA